MGMSSPCALRPAQTGGDAEKAMASLVQYSKVKGTVGGARPADLPRRPQTSSPASLAAGAHPGIAHQLQRRGHE